MISVVLPIFNEKETLPRLYRRLTDAAATWDDDYEVIAVDDGSTDGSREWLLDLHVWDRHWKLLAFSRNFGHQRAVSAGIHYATGDAVVVMDSDLQDPPEAVGPMLEKWRDGYQVVYAVRTKRKENVCKRAAYAVFYRLLKGVASIPIPVDSGDFCVMDKTVVNVLRSLPERTRFVRGLRAWAGYRQTGVVYERAGRDAGPPKYTLGKLFRLARDGLLSFSSAPLALSSWLGASQCVLSVLLIATVILWRLSQVRIFGMHPANAVGWTSLCSLILFLSGMQMLVIGIIGEYLASVFEEVKGRPPWIIAEARGIEPAPDIEPVGWHVAPTWPTRVAAAAGDAQDKQAA